MHERMITVVTKQQLKDFLKDLHTAGMEAITSVSNEYDNCTKALRDRYESLIGALPPLDLLPPVGSKNGFMVIDATNKGTELSGWYDSLLNRIDTAINGDNAPLQSEERTKQAKYVYKTAKTLRKELTNRIKKLQNTATSKLKGFDFEKKFNFLGGHVNLNELIEICIQLYTWEEVQKNLYTKGYRYLKAPKWNDIFLEQISNDDGREMVAKEILTGQQNDVKGPPLTKKPRQ